jgi:hypothetical protein
MTAKPTALPEHEPHHKFMKAYTQQQLIAYGRAEYLRGLEDAADLCDTFDATHQKYLAKAILALKEQQT